MASPATALRALDALPAHPRLLVASAAALGAAFAPAPADALRAAARAHLLELAEGALASAPPTRDGALNFHHTARRSLGVILDTAAAFAASGDARFLARAAAELGAVCAFAEWGAGEAFLDVAEMAVGVALGFDWLHAHLEPPLRAACEAALVRCCLAHARAVYVDAVRPEGAEKDLSTHTVGWVNQPHNWNQVCNAGMIAAALALGDSADAETRALARVALSGALLSLPRAMRAYAPDGAFPEGPQYYSFGTSFNVLALAMLRSALGGDAGLAAAHGALGASVDWRRHVESPTGLAFNYADNGQAILNADAFLSWLGAAYDLPHARAFARAQLARKVAPAADGRDGTGARKGWAKFDRLFALHLLWLPAAEEAAAAAAAPPPPLDALFRGIAELALFRAAWGAPRALWAGLKGGRNGHNHGHLDLGSFMLDALGQRWAVDFGSDDYNLPKYNSRREGGPRWRYLRPSNRGHNTLTLGAPAGVGAALQDLCAAAPVARFSAAPARAHAVVDLGAAYASAAPGARAARGLALLDGRARVLVQDDVAAPPGAPLGAVWRVFTEARVALAADARAAELALGGEVVLVELLAPAGARFATSAAHPDAAQGGVAAPAGDARDAARDAKRLVRRAARRAAAGGAEASAEEEEEEGGGGGGGGGPRGPDRAEMRRGVLRSTVVQNANDGVTCLYIVHEFAAGADGRIAVMFTPRDAAAPRGPAGSDWPLEPLAAWADGPVV